MEDHTTNITLYCKKEHDLVQIDGTFTCFKCGIVEDTLLMEPVIRHMPPSEKYTPKLKESIDEFCERGNIDTQTSWSTYNLFKKISKEKRRFQKVPLLAACLYVSCKKNGVARTIKEISAITGCDIKKMGKYEKIISHSHYPINPS